MNNFEQTAVHTCLHASTHYIIQFPCYMHALTKIPLGSVDTGLITYSLWNEIWAAVRELLMKCRSYMQQGATKFCVSNKEKIHESITSVETFSNCAFFSVRMTTFLQPQQFMRVTSAGANTSSDGTVLKSVGYADLLFKTEELEAYEICIKINTLHDMLQ